VKVICISRTKGSKNKVIEVSDTPVKLKTNIEELKKEVPTEQKTVSDMNSEVSTKEDSIEQLSGVGPETDKWICLWGTKPDGVYLERKIAYYVHGKVHDKGKTMNRDEEIKAALEREGWTVLIFRHGEGKVSDWANQVQEALKF